MEGLQKKGERGSCGALKDGQEENQNRGQGAQMEEDQTSRTHGTVLMPACGWEERKTGTRHLEGTDGS